MPNLMDDEMSITIPGGNFQFSGVRPENLGATEYTLVTIAADRSTSVADFDADLIKAIKKIIGACKKSPRAENLMLRLITFNEEVEEFHGFRALNSINEDDYQTLNPYGMTALFDASYSAVAATLSYAKTLIDQDFDVNGAIYILTDGYDNSSTITPKEIADWIKKSGRDEEIESLITVLVGINATDYKDVLEEFKNEANLTQFIDAGDATEQKLAKLAEFVSESISSQSQSLGSGGPSQTMNF